MNKYNFLDWDFKVSDYLSSKEIDYMIKILNSDLNEYDKSLQLYSYCSQRVLLGTKKYYKELLDNSKLTSRDTKNALPQINAKLDRLLKAYKHFSFKGYFEDIKNPYNCSTVELEQKKKKLYLLNLVFNSNLNDYKKVEFMYKLFDNPTDLSRHYIKFIKSGQNDERLDSIREALDNFDNIFDKFTNYHNSDIPVVLKYYQNNKGYFDNYEYAKFVIESFINSNISYNMEKFLEQLGITEDQFKYCVSAIKELDPMLYLDYQDKINNNKVSEDIRNSYIIKDLIEGIKTGILPDCTPFSIFEFLKRIPFKNMACLKNLKDCMNNNLSREEYNIVVNYMVSNNIYKTDLFAPFNTRILYNVKTVVNGVEISNEDNDIILDFLRVNDIPIIKASYLSARQKYINDEIDLEKLEKQKELKEEQVKRQRKIKKVLVIPSAKR